MRRRLIRDLLMIGAAFSGGLVATPLAFALRGDDGAYAKLSVFARALHYIEATYVEARSPEPLIYGAIRGMVSTLDIRSAFLDPTELAELRKRAEKRHGGVGLLLSDEGGEVVVVGLQRGSPAKVAGIDPGDRILELEGRPVSGIPAEQLEARLRGAPGTKVYLKLLRHKRAAVEPTVLMRAPLAEPSVSARFVEKGIAHVRLRQFSEDTSEELIEALERLRARGSIERLVLDLRDNSGGLLEQAVRVADLWIAEGIIVSTVGREERPEVERAHPVGTEPPYPMAVLVNEKTASASEVVAGALQDHARATIVGTHTFGKASVQTIIELEDGSALRLTVARYLTPKGRSLEGKGLGPDVSLAEAPISTDLGSDPALTLAVSHLAGRGEGSRVSGLPSR
jgi:carboxyl-terminal processing protease